MDPSFDATEGTRLSDKSVDARAEFIQEALPSELAYLVPTLIDAVSVTPEALDASGGLVTIKGAEGTSTKPSNFLLDWRKVMETTPDVALATAGAATISPWLLTLAALYVCARLWRAASHRIPEADAALLQSLWHYGTREPKQTEELAFEAANEFFRLMDRRPLGKREFSGALDRLQQLRCIEMADGRIDLREKVLVR